MIEYWLDFSEAMNMEAVKEARNNGKYALFYTVAEQILSFQKKGIKYLNIHKTRDSKE
jgi:hypothetical protein